MADTRLHRSCSSLSDSTYRSRVTHTPRSPRRRPFLNRPFLPLLAGLLVVGVLATIAQVHQTAAAAATISEREEVNNIVFELSDDSIMGVTFRNRHFRFEDNLDDAPRDFTKEKVDAALATEQKTVKETLGWDVASDAEFYRFRTELNQLRRALNEALNSSSLPKSNKEAWTELLNVIDQLLAVECRGGCVPSRELVDNIISAAAVEAAIAAMVGEFADPALDPQFVEAALTISGIMQTFSIFIVFGMSPELVEIEANTLRIAAIAMAGATLTTAHQYAEDARAIAAAKSPPITFKERMKEGAKRIADYTPTQGDNPSNYDMIHDEL